ncbi:MAG: hypothetical protein CML17_02170 [Pusillimonas sp.]|jgi:hypothetical protein|nr:hypothetical protein [Pusillimonas sp.]|tara:strand:- start:339 stop:563 length:225 start_codon:yes stop_codon:yes gene_type:complete
MRHEVNIDNGHYSIAGHADADNALTLSRLQFLLEELLVELTPELPETLDDVLKPNPAAAYRRLLGLELVIKKKD